MAILSGAIYEQYYFQRGTKTTRDKDDGLLYKMALFLAATSLAESARLLLLPAVTVVIRIIIVIKCLNDDWREGRHMGMEG
jgi:hypothetical protein